MRQRTSRATSAKPRTTTDPLTEGISPKKPEGTIKDGFWCITLQGKEFRVPIKAKNKRWSAMTSEELVDFARAYCKEKRITQRKELAMGQKALPGLTVLLRQKKLLGEIFPREKFEEVFIDGTSFMIPLYGRGKKGDRNWDVMADDELVRFTKAYCKKHGILHIRELAKKLGGLYGAINDKNLLDKIFSREKCNVLFLAGKEFVVRLNHHGNRDWQSMSDKEMIAFAKAYCKEYGITKIVQLVDKDISLELTLRNRRTKKGIRLLDLIFPRKKFEEMILDGKEFKIPLNAQGRRNWSTIANEKLVEFAKAYCKEIQIVKRSQLETNDNGLYHALHRRKLLDLVFSEIEKAQELTILADLASALESFGGSGK